MENIIETPTFPFVLGVRSELYDQGDAMFVRTSECAHPLREEEDQTFALSAQTIQAHLVNPGLLRATS